MEATKEDKTTMEDKTKEDKTTMEDHVIPLATPCVYYYPNLLTSSESTAYYNTLKKEVPWSKTSKINRWVALYYQKPSSTETTTTKEYKYRDAPSSSLPFHNTILQIKQKVEQLYTQQFQKTVQFNTCLANFYENGEQRIGWHSDREEIGRSTPIASVSLGATRSLLLRHQVRGVSDRASIDMTSGSVVFMENKCQCEYLHSVPRQSEVKDGRINLTFRCKMEDTKGEEDHERRDAWLQHISNKSNKNDKDGNAVSPLQLQNMTQQSLSLSSPNNNAVQFFGDDAQIDFDDTNVKPNGIYTCTCNIGTECHLAAEISELLINNNDDNELSKNEKFQIVARPWGVAGYVAIASSSSSSTMTRTKSQEMMIVSKLLQLRSALHVLKYHDHFHLQDVIQSFPDEEKEEDNKKHEKETSEEGKSKKKSLSSSSLIDGETLYQFYKKRLEANPNLISSLAAAPPSETSKHSNSTKKDKTTFRVTTERIGNSKLHKLRSPEVEYEVGGALSEHYTNTKPKMSDYDVNIRVDVVLDTVLVGTQINIVDLSLRQKQLPYRNSVTIKTNLAYVMLRLANVKRGSDISCDESSDDFLLVDPFCGAGTILLEALELYGRQRQQQQQQGGKSNDGGIRAVGMDVSRRALNGAADNARTMGYNTDICSFHCCDARGIRKHVEMDSADAIVSNLPWGVRTGQNQGVQDLQQMYEVFLRTSWYCLKPGGRVVMLVLRGLQMMRILRKLAGRYNILKILVVRTSNNLPCIVVAEKVGEDALHENIKDQLNYMSSFINVSAEMYHAINMEEIDEKN